MAYKGIVLQDTFLNQIRREQAQVIIHLTNGFQFRGIVKAFDSFVVLMEVDRKQIMIYKHAITTIAPVKFVNMQIESESITSETL